VSGKVLIAAIGNIFLGDDGFGVEVGKRFSSRALPEGVCVRDFGIRGFDLACALTEPWDLIVLIDATARGGEPGTVYVLELDGNCRNSEIATIDGHGLDPVRAVELARTLGKIQARLVLVACEPADFGGDEGRMGLTPQVAAAVETAIDAIEKIVHQFLETASIKQGVSV
jgi:hydrogenase maturation protease